MKIAVEGCAHGELDNIYNTLECLETKESIKIDLLICCGDFQSSRNEEDLKCMAVPDKYARMCSFYKYYTGEKRAPILTIFIGGNHEASNYLQELPYGGWVAPNIYYLGYAGVINIAGVRIGGISGIYKGRDYMKGHHECPPYGNDSKRSVYHVRNLEVFRLKQLSGTMDIFLSHDWPSSIWRYGDADQLLRFKPHFRDDINTNQLGSKPCEELLNHLKPKYWFAAHLHCKFAALVPHENEQKTRFLALDKCLPKRRFLQIVDVPHDETQNIAINYDLEWLSILRITNHLLSVKNVINYLPGPTSRERHNFVPSEDEKALTLGKLEGNLLVPNNFVKTVPGYNPQNHKKSVKPPLASLNPQTVDFCTKLTVDDPMKLLLNLDPPSVNLNESENQSYDNTTFINETDNSLDSSVRRTSMQLPEPVNYTVSDKEVDFQEESNPNLEENKDAELDDCGASQVPISKRKSDECIKDVATPQAEIINKSEGSEAITGVKKFKRRNASMYETDLS